MTGMIGHSARVLEYWQARDRGVSPSEALRRLADRIKEDTHAWLQVSAQEYSQAAPINFGAERIAQIAKASGIDADARASSVDAARRQRHALIPLDPSNWRRLFVRNGRVLSALPELEGDHPLLRPDRAASLLAVMKSLQAIPNQFSVQPDISQEAEETAGGDTTLLRPRLSIGQVRPESVKTYAFLDIQQGEQVVQRIAITENTVVIGRVDPTRGIIPEIDLTPFDTTNSVSRRHARIRLENDGFALEDLQSRNKTRLGDSDLPPHEHHMLSNGDAVSFGAVKATFRLLGTSELPVPWSPS